MRYKQKQKIVGQKDPSLEYNSKLQEQIATQIRAIRKQSDSRNEEKEVKLEQLKVSTSF